MTRIIVGCGVLVDTLFAGVSYYGGDQQPFLAAVTLGVLGFVSPLAFFVLRLAAESWEQPEVLTLDWLRNARR